MIAALFVGILGDIMQPRGPFLVFLTLGFGFVAALLAMISLIPPLTRFTRTAAIVSLSMAAVFGIMVVLQHYAGGAPARAEGLLASTIGPINDLQTFILQRTR
jgi:glucan phosphoethanolaminetransferase (alkaline phosphatase superfamily)